ncbi:hypothetical protein P692DRAFT_20910442 [Suillus brevipes Sb2]|nr:hypothetical protein P692DRAFT_20910442 [Suillus brevipes Sb2]
MLMVFSVALARAVYARTKYVLLDDPLSAVDSHTARFLYERLFRGPLMANRTVILVTHHVELMLPGTYYRMLDGRIDTKGAVKDLRAQGVLDHIAQDSTAEVKEEEAVAATETPIEAQEGNAEADTAELLRGSGFGLVHITLFFIIGGILYLFYEWGQAYGGGAETTPYIMASSAFTESEALMNGYVPYHDLQHYSNSYLHVNTSGFSLTALPDAHEHPLFYVGVYALIGFATATYNGALKASRSIFRKLLTGVVCATMRWHDVTPAGRMLNRFGKDIDTIDTNLASSLSAVNPSLATFAAAIITVVFLLPQSSRSPIFSGFGELLEGIVTVRAFSAERRFLDDLHDKVDVTTKMWYNFWMTNRWLLLNFEVGCFGHYSPCAIKLCHTWYRGFVPRRSNSYFLTDFWNQSVLQS